MFKKNIILAALLNISSLCFSQDFPETYFESSYGKLEYGFYIPENYDSTKGYPLIMYLHGYGNNYSVYLDWYNNEIQAENPCFVFTPKTPVSWGDWSGWWDNLSEPMVAALHVLDSMISMYSIDTNRLYVYGISMGGEGTFDLLHKFPAKFAAAMSICGGGQSFWAENISKTPFWMFHGSADNINPPVITERVYDEMIRLGARKVRYKNYHGYGHEIWNVAESEPSWHDWMFSHSRSDTIYQKPAGSLTLNGTIVSGNKIKLSWNDIRNADDKGNKIWYYKIFNKDTVIGTTEFDHTSFSFSTANSADTFYVSAVNYHFQESDKSNCIIYKDSTLVGISSEKSILSKSYALFNNYPNPFNPNTTIQFSIPKNDNVKLVIIDMLGRQVKTLVDEDKGAGTYKISFDAGDLSSGVYFYQMQTKEITQTKKLLFLK